VSFTVSLWPSCVRPAHVGDVRPLIVGAHLEGGPRASGGFLKDERDVLALEQLLFRARPLLTAQSVAQVEKTNELLFGEVGVL